MSGARLALAIAMGLLAATPAAADGAPGDFAFQPHPGAPLPLAVQLADEEGRVVALRDFFTGTPVVLIFAYPRCRTFCGVTLHNVMATFDELPLAAGRDFQLIAIDIDPRDGPAEAAAARLKYLKADPQRGPGTGIHFLSGSEEAVRQVTEAVGFPYRYEPELDQFLHPAGFVVAGRDGTISRYFFGADVSRSELAAALTETSDSRALGPLRRVLLLCGLASDAPAGRVTTLVMTALIFANLVGTAALVALFATLRRRGQR